MGGTGLYLTAAIMDYDFLDKDTIDENIPKMLYDVKIIGLTAPREVIYEKINKRVDDMFNQGLVDEVKNLISKYPDSKVLTRAIGYKETIKYLNKEVSIEECRDEIKKNSRHYAKRQYTWFNNKNSVKWFNVDYDNFTNTINDVIKYIEGDKI